MGHTAFGLGDYGLYDTPQDTAAWFQELLARSVGMAGQLTVLVYDLFGGNPDTAHVHKAGTATYCKLNRTVMDPYCARPPQELWPVLNQFHASQAPLKADDGDLLAHVPDVAALIMTSGDVATVGCIPTQAFDCSYTAFRIPALVNAGGTLLACAEGRRYSCNDFGSSPTDHIGDSLCLPCHSFLSLSAICNIQSRRTCASRGLCL